MESTSTAAQGTATAGPRVPARSDHVGSLLRPPELLAEIHRVYERGHTTLHAEERAKDLSRLRELEDEAIRTVVQRQIEAEVDLITDGEFRRVLFTNSFYDAVEGLEPNPEPLHFYGDDGSVVEHPGPALVSGRLRKIDSPGSWRRSPTARSRSPSPPPRGSAFNRSGRRRSTTAPTTASTSC
jgi:hypothetical protein